MYTYNCQYVLGVSNPVEFIVVEIGIVVGTWDYNGNWFSME